MIYSKFKIRNMSDSERARQEPEQQSWSEYLFGGNFVTGILMFMCLNTGLNFFFSQNKSAEVTIPDQSVKWQNGEPILQGPPPVYTSWIEPGQEFDIDVYINAYTPTQFFGSPPRRNQRFISHTSKPKQFKEQPVWSLKNLKFNESDTTVFDFNYTVDFNDQFYKMLDQNKTLYVHMQMTAENRLTGEPESKRLQQILELMPQLHDRLEPFFYFNSSVPLFDYFQKSKLKEAANLFDDQQMPKEKKSDEEVDETYYPHFKREINLHVVTDHTLYNLEQGVAPQIRPFFEIDPVLGLYPPIQYPSDFWHLRRDLVLLDSEGIDQVLAERANTRRVPEDDTKEEDENVWDGVLHLTYRNMHVNYFSYQQQFYLSQRQNIEWGLQTEAEYDEYKRVWLETDPILFGVTAVVSVLHSLFEMLAFKNDISFWNTRDSLEGISVKTLYLQISMSFIVFLYLLENETSLLIMVPQALGIPLDLWKLKKASKVETTGKFPYFRLTDKETYVESDTKKFDEEAMTYLSYVMYPLMAIYTVYSAVYNEHKGWYSFVLNTLVGGIYIFGFIQMTPQLYINYRLKSVEHMPSKTLFYRFLNTIIDDLFSFIITMPTMHRISCFRDDVIFLVYIYQRWIYKVDKTRGVYATEKKESNKVQPDTQAIESQTQATDSKTESPQPTPASSPVDPAKTDPLQATPPAQASGVAPSPPASIESKKDK